jgi:hypothetical protein
VKSSSLVSLVVLFANGKRSSRNIAKTDLRVVGANELYPLFDYRYSWDLPVCGIKSVGLFFFSALGRKQNTEWAEQKDCCICPSRSSAEPEIVLLVGDVRIPAATSVVASCLSCPVFKQYTCRYVNSHICPSFFANTR